jgi:HPr kinase/phosphorylase
MPSGLDSTGLHATCMLLGEVGILIRGGSGSGKSTLARRLIDHGERTGRFVRLVSDDRVNLTRHHGRLVARAIPAIAGHLEMRGLGLVPTAWEPAAIVRLVVDCDVTPARMPDEEGLSATLLGVTLPRIATGGGADSLALTLWRWRVVCDTALTDL